MSKHQLIEFMNSQMGLITRHQAIELGLSRGAIRHRVENGEWERIFPGVFRSTLTPRSWVQTLKAACLLAGHEAVASHKSAAAVHGLDGFGPDVVEITVPRSKRVRTPGIIVHQVDSIHWNDVTRVSGLKVTTVSRTLADLGAVVDEETLEIALDCALSKRKVTNKQLRWQLKRSGIHGKKGPGALLRLLDIRDPDSKPTASALETKLFRVLRNAKLPLPEKQYEIFDGGRLVARPDFAYPDHRLAIEGESREHHTGDRAWHEDWERRNDLTRLGWRVIHITWRDLVERPAWVVEQVASALGLRQRLNLGS